MNRGRTGRLSRRVRLLLRWHSRFYVNRLPNSAEVGRLGSDLNVYFDSP